MAIPLDFLPRSLRKTLMKFQKDGIRFAIEKEGRCLFGDEMGLGKTLQALSVAFYYKPQWPLLIIVPASMRLPWVDEIEKWFPEIQPEEINLIKNSADIAALSTAKINIVSYGLMSFAGGNFANGLLNSMEKVNFGVAILDESHFVKNRQATRTKRIEKLLKKIKRVILLTGTPSLARPEELYVQINIICPGIVGDWRSFGQRYCDGRMILQPCKGGRTIQKFDTRGASNLQELHEILKKNVMIRRLKKDVLTQLPAKRRQRIRFEIAGDSANKKELDKRMEEFKKVITGLKYQFSERTKDKLISTNDAKGAVTRLFMATGLAKAGAIQQYIENLLDGMENKFIVFCFHLAVIDAVTEILAKRHVKHVRLAGDVPPDLRANHVREFQTDPKCRVAVLSITASCTGLTLTAADHVVFAELHWTPGIMQQAEDRCHRIGQKNAVQIHYLVAKGTFDDVLWNMLSKKITVTSEALDGKTRILTADEADQDKTDLLSMCRAWIPEDDDEEADSNASYLFTPKAGKQASNNQRDIRSSFALSGQKPQGDRKKRKVSKYYQAGLVNISDSSDDNEDFKANYKATKRRKKLGDCEGEGKGMKKCGLEAIEEKSSLGSTCIMGNSKSIMGNSRKVLGDDDSGLEAIEEKSRLGSKSIMGNSKSIMGNSQRTLGADDPCSISAIEEGKEFGSKRTMGAYSSLDLEAGEEGRGSSSESSTDNSKRSVGVDHSCEERICLSATDGVKAADSISQSAELGSLKRRFGEEGNTRAKSKLVNASNTLQRNFSASVVPEHVSMSHTMSKETGYCLGTCERAANNCATLIEEAGPEATPSIRSESIVQRETDSKMKIVSNTAAETRVFKTGAGREAFDEDISSYKIVEDSSQSIHDSSFSSIESGSGGNEIGNAEGWSCACCTFLNHADIKFCEMCETKRPSMFTRIKERKRARQRRSACACDCTESKDDVKGRNHSALIESGTKDGGVSHLCASDGVSLGVRADKSGECRHKGVLQRFSTDKNSVSSSTPPINSVTPKHNETESSIPDNGSSKEGSSQVESQLSTDSIISNGEPVKKESSSVDGSIKDEMDDEFVSENQEDLVSAEEQCFDEHQRAEKSQSQPLEEDPRVIEVIQESDCTITDSDEDDSAIKLSSCWVRNSGFDLNACESEASNTRCRGDFMELESDANGPKYSTEVKPASTDFDIHNKPVVQTVKCSPGLSESPSEISNVLTEIQQFDDIDMVDDSWNDIETNSLIAPKQSYNSFGFTSASQLYAEERKPPKMDTSLPTSENDVVGDNRDTSSECSDKALRQTGTSLNDGNLKSSGVLGANTTRSLNDSFKSLCDEDNNDNDFEDFFKDDYDDDGFLGDGFDSDISVLSSEKSDYGSEEEKEVEAMDLQYKLSFESDRVFLYDEDDGPLNVNFQIPEMGFLDPEELPAIFKHPYNMKQLKAFCREWRSLTVTKQRMVRKAGKLFKSPTQLYQELREARSNPSKERFTSKQKRNEKVLTIADMIGGKVTEIKKPVTKKPAKKNDNMNAGQSNKEKVGISSEEENSSPNLLQAIDADGNPLCLFCNHPVKNGFRPGSHEARFCSSSCKEEYQFRCSRNSVRSLLFELQKGVCQLCQLDTYGLFQRIKALRKKDRRAVLETTHYTSLPANVLNNIILTPKEGLFWEADHIHAVSEGGGECGLDNYRTLCIPCHKDVTKDLMKRLRHQRKIDKSKAEGNSDIQEFFRPAKEATVANAQKRSKSVVDKDRKKTKKNNHSKQVGETEADAYPKVDRQSFSTHNIDASSYKSSSEYPLAFAASGKSNKANKASDSGKNGNVSKAVKGFDADKTPMTFNYSDASETSNSSKNSDSHEALKKPRVSHTGETSKTSRAHNKSSKTLRCSSKVSDASKSSIACKGSGSRESSAETGRSSEVSVNVKQRPSQTNRSTASTESFAQKNSVGNSGLNCKTKGKAKTQTQPKNDKFSFARMATGNSQDIKQADDCIAKLIAKSTKSRNTKK